MKPDLADVIRELVHLEGAFARMAHDLEGTCARMAHDFELHVAQLYGEDEDDLERVLPDDSPEASTPAARAAAKHVH